MALVTIANFVKY